MLVHICCSVDSHFFLQKLRDLYPEEPLTGYFYDPNIHPYSEYKLRLLDVERSCKMLDIPLIEGPYDYEGWINAVRGFEDEPEKGARCEICFDNRLETTAKAAAKLGETSITTTLLTSPKKSIEQLTAAGDAIKAAFGVEFVAPDFRKNGGTQEQFALAKEDMLYHQDYCGCIFALTKQRDTQKRLADELFSPITAQIQPESIEERIAMYEQRMQFEEEGIQYKIVRDKFLNYRLLRGFISQNNKVVPSYILSYSILGRKYTKFTISYKFEDIYVANRENIRILSLAKLNQIINKNYQKIQDIMLAPPTIEEEILVRNTIVNNLFALSPIVILEDIDEDAKYQLYIDAQTYEDTRETLVIIR